MRLGPVRQPGAWGTHTQVPAMSMYICFGSGRIVVCQSYEKGYKTVLTGSGLRMIDKRKPALGGLLSLFVLGFGRFVVNSLLDSGSHDLLFVRNRTR
jgi:hypothetical protein